MTCFLDTSAIVKLFVAEPGNEKVRALLHSPLVIADIALVELPAALHRKQRMRELSAADAQLFKRAFLGAAIGSAPGFKLELVATELPVLRVSARLVARHPLRAYDAIQLAAAMAAVTELSGCTFGSFDNRLNEAAMAEGLTLAW